MHHTRSLSRGHGPSFCRGAMRGGHPFHHHGGPPVRHASFFQPGPPFAAFGPPARGDLFGPRPGDFAPLFRFMDDGLRALDSISRNNAWPFEAIARSQQETFNPRFDVKETEGGYELRGELPGVAAKDIEVAFSDDQTLTIKGRTQREVTHGNPAQQTQQAVEQSAEPTTAAAEAQPEQQQVNDTASETASSTGSYVKPSVEDEDAPAQTPTSETEQAESSAQAHGNAAETSKQSAEVQAAPAEQQQPNEHYWYSERSVGSFQRTFNFPSRVNLEGVTASLNNGILEMLVPKDTTSQARRINIE